MRHLVLLVSVVAGFVLSPDLALAQGGLTNGALHTGTITTGETDTWTFSANVGDSITLSLGEVEPTNGFNPWLRLRAPNSADLGSASGAMAAQINNVIAPQTGVYTVWVSAHSSFPNGTGGYQLTLAKVPGALTVSPGDQGGPLTNGANHAGEITVGDLDAWTFSAAAGDNISLSIGEFEPTSGFNPWIRLLGPTGTQLGSGLGALAAQINSVNAPQAGTYTVFVAADPSFPAGTGNYVLTLAQVPGAPTVSPGDQGGPLTNGLNHPGEITMGDFDMWTFSATAGENLSVSIGELAPTSSFNPWIRLLGPTGTQLGSGLGSFAAQINNVVAPQTGTYTVIVAADASFPYGTSNYVLTLARAPAPVFVSPGDESGPITIAVTQPGQITIGDLDQWTFYAAQGDALAISVGEIEPTSSFNPWIRLIGPTGTQVGSATGAVAAQINIAAPATGRYTVIVSAHSAFPYGTGYYQLTVAGVTIPNGLGDVAVDFGPTYGLWIRYNQGGISPQVPYWQQLHGLSPSVMERGKIDANANDDLVITFPGFGVWMWMNNANWVPLHAFDATDILTVDLNGNALDEIVLNFPGYGVWVRYDDGSWSQLHNLNSAGLARGRIDLNAQNDLVISFPGVGVWLYLNNATWVLLHGLNPDDIQIANLDGNTQDDIVLNFPGRGVWVRFNNSSWFQLHTADSAGLTAGNLDGDAGRRQDLVVNFPGFGVWAYMNNSSWVQLHGLEAPILATSDLDFNGADDVILNFPGHGIWLFMNNFWYIQLHGFDPEAFLGGRFDAN